MRQAEENRGPPDRHNLTILWTKGSSSGTIFVRTIGNSEELELANTASAIKRVRSNARKAANNKVVRTHARTVVRKARAEMEEAQDPAAARAATLEAISVLDRAAGQGVIHKNNASRRKSRLMKQLAALEKKP